MAKNTTRQRRAVKPCPVARGVHASRQEHGGGYALAWSSHQRALGNQATRELIQAKLKVGAPNDRFEREADRVADQVMRMPSTEGAGLSEAPRGVQRSCAACTAGGAPCAKCGGTDEIQMKPLAGASAPPMQRKAGAVGAWTEGLVASQQSGGEPLPASHRAFFEPRFGADFGGVRIHRDSRAAAAAQSLGARAYTLGRDVVFGQGEYRPESEGGRRLIAHELTHVVQQGGSAASVIRRQQLPNAGLQRQLRQKQAELAELRRLERQLRARSDPTARMPRASQDRVTRSTGFVSDSALRTLRQVIDVRQEGATIRLQAAMQIAFLGQTDPQGRGRAQRDIPRLVQAIRDSWTVNITEGPYLGYRFTLDPRISFRSNSQPRNPRAWQIEVRATGGGPTAATWWNGLIDMNPDHLTGDRVIVIAHELYHLFGEIDSYNDGPTRTTIGRDDPANRPDLLGLVDPLALRNRLRQGRITQAEFTRQTRSTPRIWIEDATTILRALGVQPPSAGALRQADGELNGDAVEGVIPPSERRRAALEVVENRRRLAELRAGRAATESNIQWLQTVERILQLESEVEGLQQQLGRQPATPGNP